jgi:hypothetical protein
MRSLGIDMEICDLLQCVDRALDSYGSNAKQAIYWTLASKEKISSDKILSNPEAFVRALKEVFGESDYPVVKKTIIEEIKKVFDGLDSPSSSYTMSEAFEAVERSITGGCSDSIVLTARRRRR